MAQVRPERVVTDPGPIHQITLPRFHLTKRSDSSSCALIESIVQLFARSLEKTCGQGITVYRVGHPREITAWRGRFLI
jgi:hypothetical protein